MSRVVKVTISDAMYRAAISRARHEERNKGTDPGIASLMRAALRDRLSKAGVPVSELDKKDVSADPRARTQ